MSNLIQFPIPTPAKFATSIFQFVKDWCDAKALFLYDGRCILENTPSKVDEVFEELLLENFALGKSKFPKGGLETCFSAYMRYCRNTILRNLVRDTAFVSYNQELAKWVEAVTGHHNDLDVAVMEHFCWQVKRKSRGLSVERHVMPVVCGRTGSGKSVAVRKLLGPISEVMSESGLNIFGDERTWSIFHRSYVIFFDEMEKAGKVDVEAMKSCITGCLKEYRKMKTNLHVAGHVVSTFIGTSNRTLMELIYDPNSARRFWQVNAQDKCDWAAVNGIDYQKLWQGVDENGACPVERFIDRISSHQHDVFRAKHPVEEWLADGGIDLTAEPHTTAAAVFDHYRAWQDRCQVGFRISNSTFGRELKRIPGIKSKRTAQSILYNIAFKHSDRTDF